MRLCSTVFLFAALQGIAWAGEPRTPRTSSPQPTLASSRTTTAPATSMATSATAATAGLLQRRQTTVVTTKAVTVAAPLPSTAADYTDAALFATAVLNSTNVFRREHNATVAAWNATLADFAAAYLVDNERCTFDHSGGPYGENLAVGYASVHAAVDAWGNERDRFDFDRPAFTEATGHFSQLVWKDTVAVGCAARFCGGRAHNEDSTGWFLVCEYWPRGNVVGRFADEVQRQVYVVTSVSPDAQSPPGGAAGATGTGSGNGNDTDTTLVPYVDPVARGPSSGIIASALVVTFLITVAFLVDVRLTVADARPRQGSPPVPS